MPATMVGVVIGQQSRLIRRKIIVDDDSEFVGIQQRLVAGEQLIQIPLASIPQSPFGSGLDLRTPTLNPIIATQTGIAGPTITPTLLQIDPVNKVVAAAILGDINIDKPTNAAHYLINNNVAGIGWSYDPVAQTLTEPPQAPTVNIPTPPPPTVITLTGPIQMNGTVTTVPPPTAISNVGTTV